MTGPIGNQTGLQSTTSQVSVEQDMVAGNNQTAVRDSESVNGRNVAEATHQTQVQQQREVNQTSANKCWKILCSIGNAIKDAFHAFEDRAENSRLFEGFKGLAKGVAEFKNVPDMVKSDKSVAQKNLSQCEQKNILDPSHKKFAGGASAALLMQYPNENGTISDEFIMKGLATDSVISKFLTAKTKKEVCSENIEFMDKVQQLFIKDINATEMFNSDNLEYKLEDLADVFNELVLVGSDKEINLSDFERKKFCQSYHDYVDALKQLDSAKSVLDGDAAIQDLSSVPRSLQKVMVPDVVNGTETRLNTLDTEIYDNDPLSQEKQSVLDAKAALDERLTNAVSSIGRLLRDVNSHLLRDLNENIAKSPRAQKLVSHHFEQPASEQAMGINNSAHSDSSAQSTYSLANFSIPPSSDKSAASNNVSGANLQPLAAQESLDKQATSTPEQFRV